MPPQKKKRMLQPARNMDTFKGFPSVLVGGNAIGNCLPKLLSSLVFHLKFRKNTPSKNVCSLYLAAQLIFSILQL